MATIHKGESGETSGEQGAGESSEASSAKGGGFKRHGRPRTGREAEMVHSLAQGPTSS